MIVNTKPQGVYLFTVKNCQDIDNVGNDIVLKSTDSSTPPNVLTIATTDKGAQTITLSGFSNNANNYILDNFVVQSEHPSNLMLDEASCRYSFDYSFVAESASSINPSYTFQAGPSPTPALLFSKTNVGDGVCKSVNLSGILHPGNFDGTPSIAFHPSYDDIPGTPPVLELGVVLDFCQTLC